MNSLESPRIVLASSSPRRQELLKLLQVPFEIKVSGADETYDPGWEPGTIVEALAARKARSVSDKLGKVDQVIIGSDTLVVCEGQVLGKPLDREDAFHMLKLLAGNRHEVYTGVACLQQITGSLSVRHRVTSVNMKPLDDARIERYIETGEPDDKAGAYAIQGLGAAFIDSIEGCYFNVVGLPLSLLADMLASYGIEV
ncbi:Maf family protein [Paenibacillus senegalensis]|uniref:Maf family protein n=1 Tax=Paenibacillus senegalensis TaxID=1465766 RepID=UPI00028983EA|nr:Maf family protein [Paenibacillus senegalensis]